MKLFGVVFILDMRYDNTMLDRQLHLTFLQYWSHYDFLQLSNRLTTSGQEIQQRFNMKTCLFKKLYIRNMFRFKPKFKITAKTQIAIYRGMLRTV